MSIVNFKPVKFLPLLAGLLVSVYGAEVKANNLPSASNLPSDSHSNELSVLATVLAPTETGPSITPPSVASQAVTLRQAIALKQGSLTINDLKTNDLETPSTGSSLTSNNRSSLTFNGLLEEQKISGEKETSRTEASAQTPPSQSVEPEQQSLNTIEVSAVDVENIDNTRPHSDAFSHDLFLLADGGTPDFGETLFWSPARPDSHGPIGVMGDHTHGKGEFMLSYRYMFMDMDGNRSGTDSLSEAEVLQDFMVTPVQMTMQMHMLGAMYAPTEDLTLMAMLPYITKEMDHLTRNGMRFTTNTEGIGDVSFGGLYTLLDENRQRVHLNLGVSFPTGSINERDATPMGPNQILPYPMQIGSGTFDFQPGVTYLGQAGRWSWGSQAMGKIRVGENSNGYRLGNQFMLTGWGARSWTDWFSTSLRLDGRTNGNITGADARLNPSVIPTADPDLRAGTQLDVGLGLNFYVPEGNWQGTRFAVEFNLPVYRALSGPQLETDFTATAGLQTSF